MKTIATWRACRALDVPAYLLVDLGTSFQGRAVSNDRRGALGTRLAAPSVGLPNRARVNLGATPILRGTSLT